MKNITRNYGIDILRIISMLGVVFLHVLGHGGILKLEHTPLNFSVAWFFEILAYPAVNCFVLIAGYVGYKEENAFPKIKNLLSLLFTVLFYSILFFWCFTLFGTEPFGLGGLIKSFLPTTLKTYWFFSTYFGLFLLSPLLNLLIQKINLKHAFAFLSVFSLFSIISTVLDNDIFSLMKGYSLIWFSFMYLIGAMIKKFNLNEFFSKKVWLTFAAISFIVTWLSKIIMHFSGISILENHSEQLVNYVSPTIVLTAIALLCFFAKANIAPSHAPFVSFFASSAFSVYLIHDNVYVRKYFISPIYTLVDDFHFLLLAVFIIGIVVGVFLCCILIDKLRLTLFKIIRINKLSEQIEKYLLKIATTIYLSFEKRIQKTAD